MNTDTTKRPGTIVLIHGLWVTPLSFEHWIERYESRGYQVLAPAWPGMDASNGQLRRDPSPIARLGVREIADSYERGLVSLGCAKCGGRFYDGGGAAARGAV